METGLYSLGCCGCSAGKSNVKKVSLELGGKSPLIIFSDCNVDRAVRYVSQAFIITLAVPDLLPLVVLFNHSGSYFTLGRSPKRIPNGPFRSYWYVQKMCEYIWYYHNYEEPLYVSTVDKMMDVSDICYQSCDYYCNSNSNGVMVHWAEDLLTEKGSPHGEMSPWDLRPFQQHFNHRETFFCVTLLCRVTFFCILWSTWGNISPCYLVHMG